VCLYDLSCQSRVNLCWYLHIPWATCVHLDIITYSSGIPGQYSCKSVNKEFARAVSWSRPTFLFESTYNLWD
jgi:hypothetical protein